MKFIHLPSLLSKPIVDGERCTHRLRRLLKKALVVPPANRELDDLVAPNRRPKYQTGFLGLFGPKVDSIDWCKVRILDSCHPGCFELSNPNFGTIIKEISRLNEEITKAREHSFMSMSEMGQYTYKSRCLKNQRRGKQSRWRMFIKLMCYCSLQNLVDSSLRLDLSTLPLVTPVVAFIVEIQILFQRVQSSAN